MPLLLFLAALAAFASPARAADIAQAVVTKPVASLYSSPTVEADVVSQALLGGDVVVLEERDAWVKVRMQDAYTGWMPSSSLRRLAADERPYAATERVVQVVNLYANLYREPDVTRHQPLLVVPFETRLEVVAEPDTEGSRWLQVRLPDGALAWLQRGDVSFHPSPLSIREAIDLGKRFLGLPYLWGGTSSFGYDCSGFVQMLYRQRGVTIPRDTGPQVRWEGFVPVKRKRLRPGDLLFFGSSPEHVTHVGMYIGRGRFLNATTYQRPVVQISRLKDPHWSQLFVAARRPK